MPEDPDDDVLVRVKGVSKKFCRDLKKSLWYGLKDVASELLPFSPDKAQSTKHDEPELRPGEFWANKDISFELRRGECLGLIGRNGAGKTTLLKMLNGLIKPDTGTIEIHGRVGALIALGAGFNPILTGRENIYVNGSILGLTKEEIDSQIDDIIQFAEINEFIDSPVQSYSSGMQVRLGFAVATALDPDVLILDEVLAVGDAAFRAKCYQRIGQIQHKAAVIFVSHSMDQVGQVCTQILGLAKGNAQLFSSKEVGLQWYANQNTSGCQIEQGMKFSGERIRHFECELEQERLKFADSAQLRIKIDPQDPIFQASIRVLVYDQSGLVVCEWNSLNHDDRYDFVPELQTLSINVGPLHLKSGQYTLGVWLQAVHRIEPLGWSLHQLRFHIQGPAFGNPSYILPS